MSLEKVEFIEADPPVIPVLDMPMAGLQIVRDVHVVETSWLDREMIQPTLAQNADGLWTLALRRQGEYGKFELLYIESQVLLADSELGLVVVLISYHGTEVYGRKRHERVQKGQFYRYYRQLPTGDWEQMPWRKINDDLRSLIIEIVEMTGPEWARKPGKLKAERNPPSKVIMTSYKVVRVIEGRYWSLYDPTQEYILGERVKQAAKPKHQGGFFSLPSIEKGTDYLTSCAHCVPFHSEIETLEVALLECEIGGRIINYGHKMASTYLKPVRALEVRRVAVDA
jgi:hypothetical protein